MNVNVLSIGGPCEPGVYAVCRVEVSFDDENSLTIDKLLVVHNKQGGGYCVSIPHPVEDDAYGEGPTYTISPSLRRLVARVVLDAYSVWAEKHGYPEPQYAQPCEPDEWCISVRECVGQV